MNDISFDKNVVLTRINIAKNNYEKIVEQRNAFIISDLKNMKSLSLQHQCHARHFYLAYLTLHSLC